MATPNHLQSAIAVYSTPVRVRVFTFLADGVPHSRAIPHGPETCDAERDRRLGARFEEWLDHTLPGLRDSQRITRVSFVDEVQPKTIYETLGGRSYEVCPDDSRHDGYNQPHATP